MSTCVLLLLFTCTRFRAETTLLVVQAAVMAADGATMRAHDRSLERAGVPGPYEDNPLARAIVGGYPKWQRMVPAGYAELTLESLAIHELARSRHRAVRALRWLVPAAGIAGHSMALRYTFEHTH